MCSVERYGFGIGEFDEGKFPTEKAGCPLFPAPESRLVTEKLSFLREFWMQIFAGILCSGLVSTSTRFQQAASTLGLAGPVGHVGGPLQRSN